MHLTEDEIKELNKIQTEEDKAIKKRQKVKKPKQYVSNAALREEIIKSKELGVLTDAAVLMLQEIATKATYKLNYNNPDDRYDCIAGALEDCLKYWANYNPEKSDNAFGYFTQIIKNGYGKSWRTLHPEYTAGKKRKGLNSDEESKKVVLISLNSPNIYNI